MDKIEKVLSKLNNNERQKVKNLLIKIKKNKLEDTDIKKLKGFNDIFRVRQGNWRIIFNKKTNKVLTLERITETTYKFNI